MNIQFIIIATLAIVAATSFVAARMLNRSTERMLETEEWCEPEGKPLFFMDPKVDSLFHRKYEWRNRCSNCFMLAVASLIIYLLGSNVAIIIIIAVMAFFIYILIIEWKEKRKGKLIKYHRNHGKTNI